MTRQAYADRPKIHKTERPTFPSKEQREEALRETTINNIGRPDDLHSVKVHELHDNNHYRIDVYRSKRDHPQITDSFYVVIMESGVFSNPPMNKKYFDEELAARSAGSTKKLTPPKKCTIL